MPDAGRKEKVKQLEALPEFSYFPRAMLRILFTLILTIASLCANQALAFDRADILKAPSAPPSPMIRGEFSYKGMNKSYLLFSPPQTAAARNRPLLVLLHGCLQNAEEFATLTRINELAIRENFFVVLPEQDGHVNAMGCWSWFEPINQNSQQDFKLDSQSHASERDWIAALADSLVEKTQANPEAVFVAGLSAGGAMAVNLASCYPDTFAGVGVFSGVSFAAAGSVLEATKAMKLGSDITPQQSAERAFQCAKGKFGRPVHAFVFHGKNDRIVNAKNARQILDHFVAFNDLRDDGVANKSAKYDLRERRKVKGSRKSRGYTLERYATENNAQAELVVVSRLGHVWSGGAEGSEFSSPKKPRASELLWNFMSRAMASHP